MNFHKISAWLQDGDMQRASIFDATTHGPQNRFVTLIGYGILHGSKGMLVNGVLVIVIELQQAARVAKFWNDLFQHTHVMQTSQDLRRSRRN